MPAKYWSRAGLLITQWCNAACATCYLGCSPTGGEDMTAASALRLWEQLAQASPHGCRIHLTGGEPFGRWPLLRNICQQAQSAGLPPAESVETNAYWATDAQMVRDRLKQLDAAGVGKLAISTDPYHQQFVPISRVRLAAQVAAEVLGPARVQVRWQDWLDRGVDTFELSAGQRRSLFARTIRSGRDRLNGRAAAELAGALPPTPLADLADRPCVQTLLRGKGVHVGPGGWIMPATCAGIVVGWAGAETSVAACRQRLADDHAHRPIVGALASAGPVGLLALARSAGFRPAEAYGSKCHLCWAIRRHLMQRGLHGDELHPPEVVGLTDTEGPSAS